MGRLDTVCHGARASERRSSVIGSSTARIARYTRGAMRWPEPVDKLWRDLETVRGDEVKEVESLSQSQAEWRPGETEWSVGEILHHLTLAEIATGKLTTKLTREAEASGSAKPFPADLR